MIRKKSVIYSFIAILFFIFQLSTPAIGDGSLGDILNPGRLPYLKNTKSIQISSWDTTGENADFRPIGPGQTITIADIKGPGVITHIWCTIASDDPRILRNLVIKMYWDNEYEPSVLCPIGDFFGVGFAEYKPFSSVLVGMTSGGYYCYIPMPFRKSAKIQISNMGNKSVNAFYFHLNYQKMRRLESDLGYFHAQFNRENPTTLDKDYLILNAKGKGHYIGTLLNMQGLIPGNIGFLEGDEHITVDYEFIPSWIGTGTEDYLNSGWYFNRGVFDSPYHGLTIKDEEQSRISAYRFHILDTIPFKKSIRVSIEHGHKNTEAGDYSSVAYWYQKEPHQSFTLPAILLPSPPKSIYRLKGMIEAESLMDKLEYQGGLLMNQFMGAWSSDTGQQWSGYAQVFYHQTTVGNIIQFPITVEESGKYYLGVYYTKSFDYGILQVSIDSILMSVDFDGYNPKVIHYGPVDYGPINLEKGNHILKFDIIGKNPDSKGYFAGFDGFILKKITNDK